MTDAETIAQLRNALALSQAQAAGAMSMLESVRNDCVAMRKLARQLSDALITVRPLGGSELFKKHGDEYFADPEFCAAAIQQQRDALHEAKRNEIRMIRALADDARTHETGERITRKDLNNAYRSGQENGRLAAHLIDGTAPARRARHKKRGSTYTVLGKAETQISKPTVSDLTNNPFVTPSRVLREGDRLTVYRSDADGSLWCRFPDEFEDGRFEDIAP